MYGPLWNFGLTINSGPFSLGDPIPKWITSAAFSDLQGGVCLPERQNWACGVNQSKSDDLVKKVRSRWYARYGTRELIKQISVTECIFWSWPTCFAVGQDNNTTSKIMDLNHHGNKKLLRCACVSPYRGCKLWLNYVLMNTSLIDKDIYLRILLIQVVSKKIEWMIKQYFNSEGN